MIVGLEHWYVKFFICKNLEKCNENQLHVTVTTCIVVIFQAQKAADEGVNTMFDMGDEPDRRPFLKRLFTYMEGMGVAITTMPCISKQPIDLFKLFVVVKEMGGVIEVSIVYKFLYIYIHITYTNIWLFFYWVY